MATHEEEEGGSVKYRIETNGKVHRIMVKRAFGWEHDGHLRLEDGGLMYDFRTEALAEEYVLREYGRSAKRIREWRTV